MLRWAIALLLLANGLYFAWMQGLLTSIGVPPPTEAREPQRLARQIAPERVRLLNGPQGAEPGSDAPAAPAATAEAAPSEGEPAAPAAEPSPETAPPPTAAAPGDEARSCWQAAGFTAEQAELLRAELRLLGLPAGAWQLNEVRSAGRWIVYMGRYDNAEQANRKKAELRAIGLEFRDVSTNGLAPGIALGTFSSEAAAREGLQLAEQRNVRSARVVQERAESLSFALRLPAIGESTRQRIDGLGPATTGRRLQRCG